MHTSHNHHRRCHRSVTSIDWEKDEKKKTEQSEEAEVNVQRCDEMVMVVLRFGTFSSRI